jgi:hypothetical protein
MRFVRTDAMHRQGEIGIEVLVQLEHGAIIHLVHMVASQHQHRIDLLFGDNVEVGAQCIGIAPLPCPALAGQIRVQHAHPPNAPVEVPWFADANMFVERPRAILSQHADVVNAGVDTV